MLGPTLRGETVTLRPFGEADAEAFIAWLADAEVTRFLKRRTPPSAAMEREWIDRVSRSETDIVWGVELDGRLVGATGIHRIDWPDRHGTTGTLIGDRSAWGRGAGREAMRLRTRYAFTETTLHKLCSSYLEGNAASARAQAAAGYLEVGRRREQHFRDGRWLDEILTEVLREDWLRDHPPPGA